MIKLKVESSTIGGAFGIPDDRATQLTDLLNATGDAYVNNLIESDEPTIVLDKMKIVELFVAYAENDAEEAFCLFHAGQAAGRIEDYLNNTHTKSVFQ